MRVIKDIIYNPDAPEMCRLDTWIPDHAKVGYLYLHGGGLTCGDKSAYRTSKMCELLAEENVAVFNANYRFMAMTDHDMITTEHPSTSKENGVEFPVFIRDAALAFNWMMTEGRKLVSEGMKQAGFDRVYIGGSSAGSYISMMLCFDGSYLAEYGYDSMRDIAGYVFDAGQPTKHMHLLELNDENPMSIRIDNTAPLWYICNEFSGDRPKLMIITAEEDMPGRNEQNDLMVATLKNLQYGEENLSRFTMKGYKHVKYLDSPEYIGLVKHFMKID